MCRKKFHAITVSIKLTLDFSNDAIYLIEIRQSSSYRSIMGTPSNEGKLAFRLMVQKIFKAKFKIYLAKNKKKKRKKKTFFLFPIASRNSP